MKKRLGVIAFSLLLSASGSSQAGEPNPNTVAPLEITVEGYTDCCYFRESYRRVDAKFEDRDGDGAPDEIGLFWSYDAGYHRHAPNFVTTFRKGLGNGTFDDRYSVSGYFKTDRDVTTAPTHPSNW